jgi:DNA (cytosine-5)-methyltransferase 1
MVRPKQLRFVDLFAGIGGFHHALAGLDARCELACEIDSECRKVYRASFPELPDERIVEDVRSLTTHPDGTSRSLQQIDDAVPEHDILCAGFPCQPFSKSGAQLGILDRTRGTLFFEIMQVVRAKRPRMLLLENVRNLAGPRHRETWSIIIDSIRAEGYTVPREPLVISPHLIPPSHGGAPQVRERVFIAARRRPSSVPDEDALKPIVDRRPFPDWDPRSWRIADHLIPDDEVSDVERYRLGDAELAWLEAWDAFVRELPAEEIPGFPLWTFAFRLKAVIPARTPQWKRAFLESNAKFYRAHRQFIDGWLRRTWGTRGLRVEDFPHSRQKFEWQARSRHPSRRGRTIRDLVVQLRPSGIRVRPATYLPALVAITQTSIVGPDVKQGIKTYRRITPREAAVLQGVPHDVFEEAEVPDKSAYRQLGNAVNVGVARLVAARLIEIDARESSSRARSRVLHDEFRNHSPSPFQART